MLVTMTVSPTRCGFAPILFAGDIARGLTEASRLGFDAVELNLRDSRVLDQDGLIARLQALRLPVSAIATGQSAHTDGLSLYHRDPAIVGGALDRLCGHIDFAARLGCALIVGSIRGRIAGEGREADRIRETGLEAIRDCAAYARERGVTVLLEPINRYETNVLNTVQECLVAIEQTGADNLRLLLDTFHMNIEEASLEESFRLAGGRLGYVHLVDSNRRAPGMGHLDFARLLQVMNETGYNGFLGLEILPEPADIAAAERGIRHVRTLLSRVGAAARGGEEER